MKSIATELIEYYGEPKDDASYTYVKALDRSLATEQQKTDFLNKCYELQPKHYGFPDIARINEVKSKIYTSGGYRQSWKVCMECGCKYGEHMSACPDCFKRNLECSVFSIAASTIDHRPDDVVMYNKGAFRCQGEKLCYGCEHNEKSYCPHFGNPNWVCKDQEWCECVECCERDKAQNREMSCNKVKVSYAKPIVQNITDEAV